MRKVSDETALMRDAIYHSLGEAREPLSAYEVMQHDAFAGMGFNSSQVSMALAHLYGAKNKQWPLSRIPGGGHHYQWAYFRPDVVKLEYAETPAKDTRPADVPEPVPEFQFNPVAFEEDAAKPASVPVTVTEGAKCITLEVGGVRITIEMK